MEYGSVLSQPTLVLNESWMAIHTVPVRHALKLLFTCAARAVQTETYEAHPFDTWADLSVQPDEPCIRTVRLNIRVPEVILLTRYGGLPQPSAALSRRNLFRRDRHTCQYCGRKTATNELSIDHVLPRSRGGRTTWENCVLACTGCNRRKANRTPEEAGLRLLKRPDKPRWSPLLEVPMGKVRQSWERFVSEAYWNVPLLP